MSQLCVWRRSKFTFLVHVYQAWIKVCAIIKPLLRATHNPFPLPPPLTDPDDLSTHRDTAISEIHEFYTSFMAKWCDSYESRIHNVCWLFGVLFHTEQSQFRLICVTSCGCFRYSNCLAHAICFLDCLLDQTRMRGGLWVKYITAFFGFTERAVTSSSRRLTNVKYIVDSVVASISYVTYSSSRIVLIGKANYDGLNALWMYLR